MHSPQRSYSTRQILQHVFRLGVILTLLELANHLVPVFAINRTHTYAQMDYSELGYLAFITLNVMWLKFTAIWRVGRVWALADGVECVENMVTPQHSHPRQHSRGYASASIQPCVCHNDSVPSFRMPGLGEVYEQ